MPLDELNHLASQMSACNQAVFDFVDGKLDPDQLLDFLNEHSVDLDDYLDTTEENFIELELVTD